MLRIGLLTSGGDCQALNATMRGIVKTLMTNSEEPIEIYGFEDGYQGLIYSRFRVMSPADFSGILTRGGMPAGGEIVKQTHARRGSAFQCGIFQQSGIDIGLQLAYVQL